MKMESHLADFFFLGLGVACLRVPFASGIGNEEVIHWIVNNLVWYMWYFGPSCFFFLVHLL